MAGKHTHRALTLFGEEGLVVEWLHQGRVEIKRQEVLEVTVAAAGLPMVQLRLDADWPLMARWTPLDLPADPSVGLTLEKSKFPSGVLHTLPLLHEHQGQRGAGKDESSSEKAASGQEEGRERCIPQRISSDTYTHRITVFSG